MQTQVELEAPVVAEAVLPAVRPAGSTAVALVAVYAASIFAGALLLFLVEPMIAKMILPLAGGTPAVWTTSVLFFQAVLLAGYGYSHWLAVKLRFRWQVALHGALLLSPLPLLPIHLIPGWTPPTSTSPVGWLLLVLAAAVGLPFFVLSTTSPLLQHWFSRSGHPQANDPYFLYQASNLGSALGLLSYPFLLEPLTGLRRQAELWQAGYVAFLVLVAVAIVAVARARVAPVLPTPVRAIAGAPITWQRRVRWVLLAAIPSTWMLAVTAYFTTVIRPMPLLWVIPLTLYLLSFAIVFARRPLIPRRWLNRAFPFYALPLLGMVLLGGGGPFWFLAALHFGAFFLAALMCHGELAADRPAATHLTEFYWWLGVGGAVGGLATAVIAPLVLDDFYEYPIAIVAAALLRPAIFSTGEGRRARIADFALPAGMAAALLAAVGAMSAAGWTASLNRTEVTPAATAEDLVRVLVVFAIPAAVSAAFTRRPIRFGLAGAAMLGLSLLPIGSQPTLFQARDFFGVHKVVTDPSGTRHVLVDGGTIHGVELMSTAGRDRPVSYYSVTGPVGDLFQAADGVDASWNIGVIGLGAGGIGCYARTQQNWTFYEIDPIVVSIARDPSLFTFLSDCVPQAQVVLGDGRLTIAKAPEHSFDLIVLDAFGSDAIPVHLLTREALQLYVSKLRPDGMLLFNVSNRYVNLAPILATEAAALSLDSYEKIDGYVSPQEAAAGKFPSDWVVLTPDASSLGDLPSRPGWRRLGPSAGVPLWTDDFSDVLAVTRLG